MFNRKLAIALAVTAFPLLAGCGSSNNGSTPGSGIVGYQTVCTASGCTQQPVYAGSGGCIPITQPIYFAANGAQMDAFGNLTAGIIPSGGTIGTSTGTVSMSGSPISAGSGYAVNGMVEGGSITLNLAYLPGYTGAATQSFYGTLQLGALVIQDIEAQNFGSINGTGVPCVSNIAVQGHIFNSTPLGFGGGELYLYLNNTQHGVSYPIN